MAEKEVQAVPDGQEAAGMLRAGPAALGEDFGLGQFEAACTDEHYPEPNLWGRLLFILSFSAPVAGVVMLIRGSPSGQVWYIVPGAAAIIWPFAAGAVMMRRFRPQRTDQFFYYSGGLIQMADGEPEPRVMRWADLVSLSVRIYREGEGEPFIATSTVRDRQGNSMTAGVPPSSFWALSQESGGAVLARKADPILTSTVIPALISAFDEEGQVSFGSVRIDREGITDATGKRSSRPLRLAWPDMRKIDIDARLLIHVNGRKGEAKVYSAINLGESPNAFFAYHIIERTAAQANVPVTYSGEEGTGEGSLPPRLPAP
jgi:hypothetical protein